ncbi:General substrate transporter [Penicillium macrosclerotiorum]|uniref:General substrate transporter n=1 Tax=Penicillium macrosclerotiorum TaxID=303699 RepID=UPI0025490957|nr:General substrate transporter [Penicillium macrosclerotiorum]KAJ5683440.1 General substrate transporter [Penicillium macrosclerotiorum]
MLNLEGRSLRLAITVTAGSAYLLFGYDQGVLGGLVSNASFLSAIGNPSSGYLGTIVALFNIGCLIGCVISAVFGNKLGRKSVITLGCVIMIIGGSIQASAYGAGQLIAGRIISGIGNGMNTSTVPVYVSEASRNSVRGRSLAIQMSIVIFGTVIAYWLDYGIIRGQTGELVWRFPIAFQNFFALVTIIFMPLIPESPRWLYAKGDQAGSIKALSRLLGLPETHPEIQNVVAEMNEAVALERDTNSRLNIWNIMREKTELKNPRRLFLCFTLQFFQQFTGINLIAFYGRIGTTPLTQMKLNSDETVTIVLETNVGLSTELSSLVAGLIQIAFWVGTFPPIFLIDRLGRRKVLMLGSTMLCLSMTLFTVGVAMGTPSSSKLALGMLIIFEISFGMSWNSVPWLYAPEITPLNLRHVGAAVGCFSEWLFTFVIAQMSPPAIANTGWRIYILFCIMNALSIPFVYFVLPETSGKSLEEIDYIFVKHRGHINELSDISESTSGDIRQKGEGQATQVERA